MSLLRRWWSGGSHPRPSADPDPRRRSALHGAFHCAVCGGNESRDQDVLWQELIDAWELSPAEAAYVNRQQGTSCVRCNANLRSIALAEAILDQVGYGGLLEEFVDDPRSRNLRLVEINEAGTLSSWLSRLPGHRLLRFPEHDMMALNLEDECADLVIHSDTLEHIPDPVRGLSECRRLLVPYGAVCFTVPIIVGRLSRSREGLKSSYHGKPEDRGGDLLVQTEFGADVYETAFRAGFARVTLNAVDYPSAIALTATG